MATTKTSVKGLRRGTYRFLGNAFLALGIIVLIGAGIFYVYGEQKADEFAQEAVTIQNQLNSQRTDGQDETGSAMQLAALPSSIDSSNTPKESLPPIRIVISNAGIDSLVVETAFKDGEWPVPKFVVGHLQATANPGEKGNMAMAGHVSSVNSGNVFAKLDQVKVGDDILVYTKAGQYLYRTNEVKVVANDDISVLEATPESTLTLITCTGTWNPIARDYMQRLIVKAKIFQDSGPVYPGIKAR